jgi:hypothetical protein
MKGLLTLAVVVGSLAFASPIQASGLPRVYISYPNLAPCYQAKKEHGKYVNHRVACYQVRPSTISVTEDGNGFLSDITWSKWARTFARGSALQGVRCFGVTKGETRDPKCAPYHCTKSVCSPGIFSYNVPAKVRLSVPVTTRRGVDFTLLKVSSARPVKICLPPANGC